MLWGFDWQRRDKIVWKATGRDALDSKLQCANNVYSFARTVSLWAQLDLQRTQTSVQDVTFIFKNRDLITDMRPVWWFSFVNAKHNVSDHLHNAHVLYTPVKKQNSHSFCPLFNQHFNPKETKKIILDIVNFPKRTLFMIKLLWRIIVVVTVPSSFCHKTYCMLILL